MSAERGPYLTPNKVVELERRMAATEARLGERLEQLRRELDALAGVQEELLRATIAAQLGVYRGLRVDPHGHATPIRADDRKEAAQ